MQLFKRTSSKSQPALQAKACLNLEHLLGMETSFLLCKESQTLAIICKTDTTVLAFDDRETLLEWQAQLSEVLGQSKDAPTGPSEIRSASFSFR